jgi:hypothetical protein
MKRVIFVLFAFALFVSVTGCNSQQSTPVAQASPTEQSTATAQSDDFQPVDMSNVGTIEEYTSAKNAALDRYNQRKTQALNDYQKIKNDALS